jgi:hypothetical protein
MSNNDLRISRVKRTLRWFEEDIPLLHMRVKELSPERQESAKKFAAALIDQTRAELKRLLQNADLQNEPDQANLHEANLRESVDSAEPPCEPAD